MLLGPPDVLKLFVGGWEIGICMTVYV